MVLKIIFELLLVAAVGYVLYFAYNQLTEDSKYHREWYVWLWPIAAMIGAFLSWNILRRKFDLPIMKTLSGLTGEQRTLLRLIR